MSKALPIVIATALGAAALVPVYYATQHPAQFLSSKNASFDAEHATPIQKISYYFGYKVANEMTPPDLDVDAFNAGARAGHAHEKSPYTEQELKAALEQYVAEQKSHQTAVAPASAQAAVAASGADDGAAFLANNAKQPDVKTTASGLQYKVVRQGTGKQPQATDTVKVNYEGKLINGQIFDSSYQRGEPIEFALNQVIPGWTEGLQLMKEGAEYQFFIPARLAYGDQDMGSIPPNSTLIFKVELLQVK